MTKREKKIQALMQSICNYRNPPLDRKKLGPMVEQYLTAMLRTTVDDRIVGSQEPLEKHWKIKHMTEAALAQSIRDCVHFYWRNKEMLEAAYAAGDIDEGQCGEALWMSRNHFRNAFEYFGKGPEWRALDESARGFGTQMWWVNDDNKVEINHQLTWRDMPNAEEISRSTEKILQLNAIRFDL